MSDEMVQETSEETVAHDQVVAQEAPASAPVVAETATMEEPTPAPAAAPSAPSEDEEDVFEKEMRKLGVGDPRKDKKEKPLGRLVQDRVVTGVVMRVDKDGALVDVGAKSEGIIRPHELSSDPNVNPEDVVKVGDEIRVLVLESENREGIPVLSKKRADFEQAWDVLQRNLDNNDTVMAPVLTRVKGGLVVDLGIRGFIPASHVGNGSLKVNLDKYVGITIPVKVLEVDRANKKVILSNKKATEEEREAKVAETKANLKVDDIKTGTVRRLTPYGAFVDLGGIDGLLHISEMSWTRINDPREVLREGQDVKVIVLKIDMESNRVSLGMRQILPDPWKEIALKHKEGDVITGMVTRLAQFGAFVQVDGGVEGVIQTGEMGRNKSDKNGNPLVPNLEVEVKILSIRPDERKMSLSVRALLPPEEQAPREPREPRENTSGGGNSGTTNTAPRRTGRERGGERDDVDFARYTSREEPRYTLADAFANATNVKKSKKDRRTQQEQEDDNLDDIETDLTPVETEAETEE